MSSNIKYSVIVPVFNASKSIGKCLDSIINSTLKELEIICVNDCSTDISLAILRKYQKMDSRVKIINLQENKGVAAARNEGLKAATGTYIGFVDSDDYVDENHLEDIYKHMERERSEINLISFKFIKPDKIIYFPDLSKFFEKFGSNTQGMQEVEKLTLLDDYCWRLSIRKTFWEKNKIFFPEGIKGSEDQCFWKPLELKAKRVSFLENYGYNYIWNAESLTKKELSSFETVKGIDELMRRLPSKYHLNLMEKCLKRITDFKMKNQKMQNRLKRNYIRRIYKKAKELKLKKYEIEAYSYKWLIFQVCKTKDKKQIKLLGIPVFKINY